MPMDLQLYNLHIVEFSLFAHSFTSVRSLKAIKQTYIQLRASMDTKDRKENQQQVLYKQRQNKTAHFKNGFSFRKSLSSSLYSV